MDEIREIVNDDLILIKGELNKLLRHDNSIDEEINSFLNSPSKYIRSVIVLLYLYSNNKKLNSSLKNILVGTELMHNASLLHDDVIDDAETRRGKTTIAKNTTPYISILSGDYLVSLAVNKLIEVNNFDVLKKFSLCTELMSRAEIRQYLNRGNIVSQEEYLEICRDKTGCLFETVMESSALISGLAADVAKRLGLLYGTLFQIKNDLEISSSENDKKNGVYTAVDIFGIEKTKILTDNYKKEMRDIIVDFPNERYRSALMRFTDSI